MILRLTSANKRRPLGVWTMAFVFAIAPVLSLSLATPAGAFSAVVVHAHGGGDKDHSHHSHDHDHDHDHSGSATHDGPDPLSDGGTHHGKGNGAVHVHHDACCPSVLVPTPVADLPEPRPGMAFAHSLMQSLRGASPDNLLRPPISQLHI